MENKAVIAEDAPPLTPPKESAVVGRRRFTRSAFKAVLIAQLGASPGALSTFF
jgi:hypothetical protein